ncbi:hypothetical protein KAU45_11390 [bacterium]|nr:hypothetical protein [bacterium]
MDILQTLQITLEHKGYLDCIFDYIHGVKNDFPDWNTYLNKSRSSQLTPMDSFFKTPERALAIQLLAEILYRKTWLRKNFTQDEIDKLEDYCLRELVTIEVSQIYTFHPIQKKNVPDLDKIIEILNEALQCATEYKNKKQINQGIKKLADKGLINYALPDILANIVQELN